MTQYNVLVRNKVTFAIYDVLGDIVCGGFAQPMRKGYAYELYLITSGELMALYAANNIASAVTAMIGEGAHVSVAGIVNNMRNVPQEVELIAEFAQKLGVPVMANIPRSVLVQHSELQQKTVVEAFPDSDQAQAYTQLANTILENDVRVVPTPIGIDDIVQLLVKYQAFA